MTDRRAENLPQMLRRYERVLQELRSLIASRAHGEDHAARHDVAGDDPLTGYALVTDWQTFSPNFNSGVTINNGVFTHSRYLILQSLVIVEVTFTHGSSTSVTGQVRLDLPVEGAGSQKWIWDMSIVSDSGTFFKLTGAEMIPATPDWVRFRYGSEYMNATTPAPWGSGDEWMFRFMYRKG